MSDRLTLHLIGSAPLLMHNTRLADPFEPIVQEMKPIQGKRKKTEEDYLDLARLEFLGGLYMNPDGTGPMMPGQNVHRALLDAAKITREGKTVERGIILVEDAPLLYSGPRDPEALWANENFRHRSAVKVQTNRIFRTRPQFRTWEAEAKVIFDSSVIEAQALGRIAETAGTQIGLGDWRPRYGRFIVKIEEA